MASTQVTNNNKNLARRRVSFALRPITTCVLAALAQCAAANPTGHQVAAGSASVQASGKTVTVTNTPGAILNWQSFSIAPGELTKFVQQSSASAVLNRVVASNPSSILGTLQSNGRVFLVNPHGIVVGAGALIDTAGFVASTLNIADKDFLAGRLKFEGGGAGVLRNEGTIQATRDIFLVGPQIENAGIIRSAEGDVVLAAGKSVTISSPDAHGVQFGIQAPEDSVVNLGSIQAANAVGLFAGTLKHSGEIKVASASLDTAGRVVLSAQKDNFLEGNATVSVDNSAGKGGSVAVLGERVGLFDQSTVSASGAAGGGEILIGGDYQGANRDVRNASYTFVGPDAQLRADAVASGDGGKIIVWADKIARFFGEVSVRGGAQSGDGGFIETSGKETLTVGAQARVGLDAPVGRGGRWLLDPKNIRVHTSGGNPATGFNDDPTGDATIHPGFNGITTGTVTLQANNNITFDSEVDIASPVALTAQAGKSIFVNQNIRMGGTITLTANDDTTVGGPPSVVAAQRDDGTAELTMLPGTTVRTTGAAGIVFLRMNPGSGRAATPDKSLSGNITVANVQGVSVSVEHVGPSANGAILRAADSGGVAPVITVANGGTAHLELQGGPGTNTGSIGTSAAPIQISAGAAANTIVLESHYHGGGTGIFIDATSNVQIGGADPAVFNGGVRGLQALNENGATGVGPVRLTSTGTITQQVGGAGCGNTGAGAGGPICAGTSTAGNPMTAATDTITLRADEIDLTSVVRGTRVALLANSMVPISVQPDTQNLGAPLELMQAEIDLLSATTIQIGGRIASGDAVDSGAITFESGGGGALIIPAGTSVELRSGGNIISRGDASGMTDLFTTNQNITLVAAQIGAAGANNRFKVSPGTGTVAASTASMVTGGIYLEHNPTGAGATPDALISRYILNPAATQPIDFATSNGKIIVDGPLGAASSGAITLTTQTAAVTAKNIDFTGSTVNGASLTLDAICNPACATGLVTFNSGTNALNAPIINTSAIVSIDGGATVNFNAASDSTLAGALNIFSGTLGGNGAGRINANGGLGWNGGSIAKTGGAVTLAGATASLNAGATNPQLSGNLSTNVLNVTDTTLNITGTGVLTLTGTTSTLNNATINNAGRFNYVTAGDDLVINTNSVFTNSGTFDIQQNRLVRGDGTGVFHNNSGTVLKSGGGGDGGFNNTVTFNTTNAAHTVTSGRLTLAGNGTHAGTFTSTGNVAITGGTHTFQDLSRIQGNTTLHLAGGTLSVPAGTVTLEGTLEWDGLSTISGPGTLKVSADGGLLNLRGGGNRILNDVTLRNEGTVRFNSDGNDLVINNNALFNNLGTFDIQRDIFAQTTTAPGLFHNNGGTVMKSGGTSGGGFLASLPFNNSSGTLTVNAGNGSLQLLGGGSHDGTFTTTGNVQLVSGTHFFANGSSIPAGSTLHLAGGTLSVPAGTATVAGTLEWDNTGVISGAGPGTSTLAIAPTTGSLNVSGGGSRQLTAITLRNEGTVRYNSNGNDLLIDNNAVFNNIAGATFDIQRDIFARTSTGVGTGTFNNFGTVVKSGGTGNGGFDATLTFNTTGGTLTGNAGTLQLFGSGSHSGTFTSTGNVQIVGGTHTFADASSIPAGSTLHLAGGLLTVPAGTVTVNGTLEWDNTGEISGPGTLRIANGALLNLSGGGNRILTDVTLRNEGTVRFNTLGNDLVINDNSLFNNLGTFEIQRDIFAQTTLGTGLFHNNGGTVTKSGGTGGGGFLGSLPFNNSSGTLTVNGGSGSLQLLGGGSHDGTFTATGNVQLVGGTHFFANGSSLPAGSTLHLAGGTLSVPAGTATVSGTLEWDNTGVISGAGPGTSTLTIAPTTGLLNISGGNSRQLTNITLRNEGAVRYNTLGNDLLIDNNAVFNNIAGATFDIQRDIFARTSTGPGTGTFNNSGSVLKSAGGAGGGFDGTLLFNNNGGTLTSTSGMLQLFGDGSHTGTFTSDGTVQIMGGVHTFNDGSSIADAPLGATLHLVGGTLRVPASSTATVTGTLEWDGQGVISGPGTLKIAPTTGLLNITGSNSRQLTNVTLRNEGTVRFNTAGNDLRIDNNAVFNNIAGATFDIQGNIFAQSAGTGAFNNAGTVVKSAGTSAGGFNNTLPVSNNATGVMTVTSGTLQASFVSATNNGTINVPENTVFSTGGTPVTNNRTIAGKGTFSLGAGVTLTNNGTLSPGTSPGILTIDGNLAMTANSMTSIQIGGPTEGTEFDVLAVTGNVQLGGTLNVTHLNGFSPIIGNSFRIITHNSRTPNSDFATKNYPTNFTYSGPASVSDYTITVGTAPTENRWIGTTSTWETPGHWSLGHVPQSYEDAVIPNIGTPGITDTVTVSAAGQMARSVTSAENLLIANGGNLALGTQNSSVNATLGITGGTLTANGALAASTLNLTGGTLTGTGAIAVSNAFTWSGGSLTGTGPFTTAASALSTINNASDVGITGRTWNNFGTVNWTGTGSIVLSDAAAAINNKSSANWNIRTTSQTADIKGPGTFTNEAGGTINAEAPFTGGLSSNSIHPATVNHAGTINLVRGDIDFDNLSTVNFSGPINMANGTRLLGYTGTGTTWNFNAGTAITVASGTATIEQNFPAVNVNGNVTFPSGLIYNQTGPTLTANAPLTFAAGSTYALSSGFLQGTGGVTIGGTGSWSGGTVIGTFATSGSGILNLTGAGTKGVSGAVLTNNGVMNLSGAGSLQLANNASLVNNGRLDIQSDAGIQNNASTPTTFVNAATLIKSAGTGVSTIGSNNQLTFTNAPSGIIIVQSGTLQANAGFATSNGAPTNSGAIILLPNTTFSTNGAPLTNNGVIRGFGTFDLGGALFTNIGTVTPGASPGALTIGGDYTQGPSGTLAIDIAGTEPGGGHDVLRVTGTANLGGTLHVLLGPEYVPAAGDTYSFMTYAQHTGDFANIVLPPGFGDAQPGPTRYSVSSLLPLLVLATNTSASLGANDVLALKNDQNINTENLEQVREGDDRMRQKGAVCR